MNMSAVEQARHTRERGDILRTLQQDYAAGMTSVANLLGALDLQGVSLSPEGLEFHLVYLADSGYVRIWRASEMPGWRRDRPGAGRPETIKFAKLLPRGLRLIDGREPKDAGVSFA